MKSGLADSMLVLVVNSGSSSVKIKLLRVSESAEGPARPAISVLREGAVEGIAEEARLSLQGSPEGIRLATRFIEDHAEALRWLLDAMERLDTGSRRGMEIDAVGHRVVHGGERFRRPVRVDAGVLAEIEQLSELAPLHNPACLAGIRGARERLGEQVPMVAVFDTAFHATLPPRAAQYAIPQDLARKHGIRRYGFHGIAHASLAAIGAASLGRPLEQVRVITLQLGNGCSATAVDRGRSVDTSMGFTPL